VTSPSVIVARHKESEPAYALVSPPSAVGATIEQPVAVGTASKPNELLDRRTATSDTVDNGNGTVTTTLYSEQVYYEPTGTHGYVPVRVGFAPTLDGSGEAVSANAPVAIRVGRRGIPGFPACPRRR